ncbi:NAD(P)-dependent oxidoreductase [Patescibacteria group bacterium]|nr:NAD(P)-dependent oxidoreductase [Patescibacteria group bacterium]MBU0963424.1 NAD(P)-dependent oxidoreductase [Patescibacteria group bacterium]
MIKQKNDKQQTYLITGAKGIIGEEIINQLNDHYHWINHIDLGLEEMDVTNYQQVLKKFKQYKPDTVIHLAAITNVDWCEENPAKCKDVNVDGVKNICRAVKEINTTLVYPSTFYVYNGKDGKIFDDRTDQPKLNKVIGYYSKTKLLGEQLIKKYKINKYYVIRIGALFGGRKRDKKFVGKILKLIEQENELKMINDRFIQPTYVKDLVTNMLKLIMSENYGTYNIVGHGSATYYQYAKKIIEYARKKNIKVIPINSSQFKEKAPRAKNLTAINGKLQDINLDLMRKWQVALKDYIQNDLKYKSD